MTDTEIKKALDELVSDLACCDRSGCRCWQAKEYLKTIARIATVESEKK